MYDTKGRGDAGPMSLALVPVYDADTNKCISITEEHEARPRIGVAMRVGTFFSRSMHQQDYWQTTLIKEIVEDTPEQVVFKTQSGSTYTWKQL